MRASTWDALVEYFEDDSLNHAGEQVLALHSAPIDESTIEQAEMQLGVRFDPDYREFVKRFGCATVKQYPIFGIEDSTVQQTVPFYSVVDETLSFRTIRVPGTRDWCIVSEENNGDPIGISPDGTVWAYPHDTILKEPLKMATNFESFLRRNCLWLPPDAE